mmetsp:Transcript_26261/g.60355  ORF Transcript_26261/g.60355 Transcript_26261/m.60355 type:complete len:87 (-) Transcript_26261:119-379(-)
MESQTQGTPSRQKSQEIHQGHGKRGSTIRATSETKSQVEDLLLLLRSKVDEVLSEMKMLTMMICQRNTFIRPRRNSAHDANRMVLD